MPNHWETSARPLFVKTVFVNGNRHAVLFEKDPLLNCGNFPFKKISRSNFLLSFASDLSISSSESLDGNEESKTSKFRTTNHSQHKDLSSDLQNCLVKLKLASGSLENKNKHGGEKCFCNSKPSKRRLSSEQKEKKLTWIHEKMDSSTDQSEPNYEEPKGYKLTERKSSRNSGCYIYNLENNKRRKNYCFVKISSQAPKLILNCSCENNWKGTHKCNYPNKNNFVISATIHNIVMSSSGNENLLENNFDYVFENSELYWNNYLTRSYYNSLSERVLQWLDLSKKRKKKETPNLMTSEGASCNSTERIFSGKTFVRDFKKTECSCSNKILTNQKTGNVTRNGIDEEDIAKEVTGEPNVETAVSTEKLNATDIKSKDFIKCYREDSQNNLLSQETVIPTDLNLNLKGPIIKESSTSISNLIKPTLKMRNLFLKYDSKECCSFRDQKRVKKISDASTCSNKDTEEENSEEDESITTTLRRWQKKIRKKSSLINKSDNYNRQSQRRSSKHCDEYSDKIKSHFLTEEFTEKNQKSINNLNITQTRPLLIQNLLSPQQQSKISYFQEEKIVWASEKNTGRLQLHIFLPTVQFRDQSDDSSSECENFLNT